MNNESPLACDMNVFTPDQRESHIRNTMDLVQALQHVQSVENGYEFRFPNQTSVILKIAEFIAGERLCCPFLHFSLSVGARHEPLSLSLTGPEGTREFLRAEFNGVIP